MIVLAAFYMVMLFNLVADSIDISAVKTENSTFLLIYNNKVARLIPDEETVRELGFQASQLTVVSHENFSNFEIMEPIYTLKMYAINPDEVMRVLVQKAQIMNPIQVTRILSQQGYFNPSIAAYKERVLMCWGVPNFPPTGQSHANDLHFGWLNLSNDGNEDDKIGWKLSRESFLGIGEGTFIENTHSMFLQDGRVLPLSDESLLITYSSVLEGGVVQFHEVTAAFEPSNNTLSFSRAVQLGGNNEKNWIPFEHEDAVYYVQSINPLHIVRAIFEPEGPTAVASAAVSTKQKHQSGQSPLYSEHEEDGEERRATTSARKSSVGARVNGGQKGGNPVIKTVFRSERHTPLPWRPEYGNHSLRGSFGATLVRGVYLTFFHTKVYTQPGVNRFTYFMGAMALCPSFPFRLHRMSSHPLLTPQMYNGPWMWNSADYIVYPTGFVLSNDSQHMYLSVGLQNKELQIIKLSLDELIDSMALVTKCSED